MHVAGLVVVKSHLISQLYLKQLKRRQEIAPENAQLRQQKFQDFQLNFAAHLALKFLSLHLLVLVDILHDGVADLSQNVQTVVGADRLRQLHDLAGREDIGAFDSELRGKVVIFNDGLLRAVLIEFAHL